MTTETAAPTPAPDAAPAAADTPKGRYTIEDAIASMAKARETAEAAPPEPATEDESEPETSNQADEPDSVEGDEGDASAATEDEETEDGEEAETEETEGEDTDEADDDDPLVALADGSKVPQSELIKGYQRLSDYTRKTQALAEQRKETETRQQAATEAEQRYKENAEKYGGMLDALSKVVDAEAGQWEKIDWNTLRAEDPQEFLIKREEYRDWQERQRAVKAEQERLAQEQEREQQKAIEAARGDLRAKLMDAFPHWTDSTALQAETKAMADTANAIGFTEQEMAATLDPRAWQLLWKAAQYDRLQAARKSAKAGDLKPKGKAEPEPKQKLGVLKTQGARPSPRTTQHAQLKALDEKFRKTGSFEDAYQAYVAKRRAG